MRAAWKTAVALTLLAATGCGFDNLDVQGDQVARVMSKHLKGRTVAVFEFPDQEGCVTQLGNLVTQQLTVDLSRTLRKRKGVVVERRELAQVARSADIDMRSGETARIARSWGKLVGAEVVVLGSAIDAGSEIYVTARAVDVATGQIVTAGDIHLPRTIPNRQMVIARPDGPSLLSTTGAQCAARPAPSYWDVAWQ